MDDRLGEVEAAAEAARGGADREIAHVFESETGDEFHSPPLGVLRAQAVQSRLQEEVLARGQVVVDADELRGIPDPLANAQLLGDDIETGHVNRAGRWRAQRREDLDGR